MAFLQHARSAALHSRSSLRMASAIPSSSTLRAALPSFQSLQFAARNGSPVKALSSRPGSTSQFTLQPSTRLISQIRARVRFFTTAPTAAKTSPAAASSEIALNEMQSDKGVSRWLFCVCGVVFCIVVIGGATRLTRSGLSMTSWKFTGEKPPSSEEEWEIEFGKYKQHPEYKRVNVGMTLPEFKFIYWMEWSHRMAARAAGVIFGLPFLYFLVSGRIRGKLLGRLSALFALGGVQGLIGWWMVRSGLKEELLVHDQPRVSPYRLTVHLCSAFIIYMLLLDTAMKLWPTASSKAVVEAGKKLPLLARTIVPPRFRGLAMGALHMAATTVISGALVAGNQAGFIYNEWPLMGDGFIPADLVSEDIKPMWRQFFEHGTLVQFDHRILAYSTMGWVTYLWASSRKLALPSNTRLALNVMFGLVYLQATLGISTLLLLVPVPLGVLHQAGSLTVLTSGIWLLHTTRKQPGAGPSALRVPMRVATVALLGAVAYQVGKSMMSSDTEAKPALLGKEKATIEVIEEPQATPTKP